MKDEFSDIKDSWEKSELPKLDRAILRE